MRDLGCGYAGTACRPQHEDDEKAENHKTITLTKFETFQGRRHGPTLGRRYAIALNDSPNSALR